MKTIKISLTLLLLALFTLVFTLGVVGQEEKVTLTITHTMTGGADRTAFDKIVAAYEQLYPNVEIKQRVQSDDVYEDEGLITMVKGNNPPDIYFQWGGEQVARYARGNFAANLTDAVERGDWKMRFSDVSWSPASYDGQIYMIPDSIDVTTVIWYNKKMFDEYGLEEPDNWDDFVDICGTLKENGITPFTIGNKELWPLGNWASHIVSRFSGKAMYDEVFEGEEKFANPAFTKGFEILEEMANNGYFNRGMPGVGADQSMINFFMGNAAMHPIGSWLVPQALESAPKDFKYGLFNTPPAEDGKGDQNSVLGLSSGYQVSAETDHFEQAISFLRFYMGMEDQKLMAEAGNFSPIIGVLDIAEVPSHTAELAALFENSSTIIGPPDVAYPVAIADTFYQGAAYVAGGEKTAEEALEWVDKNVKEYY
ncbi:MAG: ABC transporter substrate-binding protein [Candidatus Acetothermia bacterium]